MGHNDFEKLVQIQVEIADQIIAIENEIEYYEKLEKELVLKRDRELHKKALGCKDEQVETEFAIHYIQVKLQQKKELYDHLRKAFQHRSEEYVQTFCG
ncbi:hypothetical protein BKP45_00080 [Anaerobacillus alkalidiazotrophicus]|uniref:Uncharacterized protein n=1 Tax=Anaerobacillus alkalidiazotrophicus TaxID=472963 RepID=A0A1S2M936_9BACI|nr:hypothetical protein [Anaerobacillus alkalidiazotrophicus]OIJ21219.1 hypothetical protein BKP45_00080 [Anaerobacillus alkalidiazotrophicus]